MFGDFNNIIVQVFESLSRWFTDLSCKASEVLDETDGVSGAKRRIQRTGFLLFGAISIILYGVVGIIYAIFHAIISIFMGSRYGKVRRCWSDIKSGMAEVYSTRGKESKSSLKDLLPVFLVCVAMFAAIFWISSCDLAKKANQFYFHNRININEFCQNSLPSVNTSDISDNPQVYHMRKSMECTKTSPRVERIRESVNDGLPAGIHFATLNDYLVTLFALGKYDVLDLFASLETGSVDRANEDAALFHRCLENSCKDLFAYGQFYTSDACLELVMKFSDYGSISLFPNYNNSFYLMRLFNENIIDRYCSTYFNNEILASIIKDTENVKQLYNLNHIGSSHEHALGKYLDGLCYFYDSILNGYKPPTDFFMDLYSSATSDMIKQYSLYMALRSQCVYVAEILGSDDDPRYVNECVSKWKQIEDLCRDGITYPYLLNTLEYHTVDFRLSN